MYYGRNPTLQPCRTLVLFLPEKLLESSWTRDGATFPVQVTKIENEAVKKSKNLFIDYIYQTCFFVSGECFFIASHFSFLNAEFV